MGKISQEVQAKKDKEDYKIVRNTSKPVYIDCIGINYLVVLRVHVLRK